MYIPKKHRPSALPLPEDTSTVLYSVANLANALFQFLSQVEEIVPCLQFFLCSAGSQEDNSRECSDVQSCPQPPGNNIEETFV